MKIDKVIITIENVDEENATVRLTTSPMATEEDDIEDTPAVLLGSAVWDVVQEFLEQETDMLARPVGMLQ